MNIYTFIKIEKISWVSNLQKIGSLQQKRQQSGVLRENQSSKELPPIAKSNKLSNQGNITK